MKIKKQNGNFQGRYKIEIMKYTYLSDIYSARLHSSRTKSNRLRL